MKKLLLIALVILTMVTGCIKIESLPQKTPLPSSQPGLDEQDSFIKAKPVIEVFIVNPPLITSGETAILSWTVSEADSISLTPGIGQVESTGTWQVSPNESTSYTLTANNSEGTVTSTIMVNVQIAQPNQPPTFAVVEIIAATEPSPDHCPETLYADITTNGAGTINYRWESTEGGGFSYTFSESFAFAGTKRVTLIKEMRVLPSGMYQLRIMSPNDIVSNSTHYTTCAP